MKKVLYVFLVTLIIASLWIIPSSSTTNGDLNNDGAMDLNDAIFGLQVLAGMHDESTKPACVMINLGDSLTNGTQSGLKNVHEDTQKNGFVELLAAQLRTKFALTWSNPYLTKDMQRKKPDEIPYNLGVDSSTISDLIFTRTTPAKRHLHASSALNNERSNVPLSELDPALLEALMTPIPEKKGSVSQLEAALYVASLHPGQKIIFTLWIGSNDVLWSVINNYGTEITMDKIEAYLNNTEDQHDLNTVKSNLTDVVNQLKAVPNSHVFIATLPYMTKPAFFFTKEDIERLAQYPNPDITALQTGESIGLAPFLNLAKSGTFSVTSSNLQANTAIGTLPDSCKLSSNEIAVVDARIDAINTHIKSLKEPGKVSIVNTFEIFQAVYENTLEINGHKIYKTFGCGGFSFDAFHPSNTTHAYLANAFIEKLNESLKLSIPLVDVKSIFENDSYQDRDGDHFAPGPGPNIIGTAAIQFKLFDCDDSNKNIVAPFISGVDCDCSVKK
jgi:lysophospholipase L1-like esterase